MKNKNHWGQYAIFFVSLIAMVWSLYYQYYWDFFANLVWWSLFPAWWGYVPCLLCRWARILMYPLVWLSGISLLKWDRSIVDYILPISIVGIILETYHYLLQKTDRLDFLSWATLCTKANPCNALQVNYFWFITIPFMCLVAFVLILIACIYLKQAKNVR
jgi:disulfide bond formation protein DsbB